ncbi:MAG: right-handed parallel beta-helix repeat-containing protein [Deltaproteobacteria bacterium]|nr:right-handed parallel beta-helix repeat-containing protein [Deltaproteobacteria bacterium]
MLCINTGCDEKSEKSSFDGTWGELNPSGIDFSALPSGNSYYVDINNGSDEDGDGSITNPWKTLDSVLQTRLEYQEYSAYPYTDAESMITVNPDGIIKSGDTIILREGHYGALSISRIYNTDFVTITSMTGETVSFESVEISSASYFLIENIMANQNLAETPEKTTLLAISNHNYFGEVHHVIVRNSDFKSIEDSSTWTINDWNNIPSNGASISGNNVSLTDCTFKNVNFGISVTGSFVDIINNTVENFAGDGLRGLGSDLLFEGNTVKNCFDVNENHDDGFQSWEVEGVSPERVVLRNNIILNYEDFNQPFKGYLQGIGCFDGFYKDWIVENNLIIVDHWHGITFMGAKNVVIRNNTVVNRDPDAEPDPWIRIDPHKDGRNSAGCIITGNIAVNSIIATGDTVETSNYLVDDNTLDTCFADPSMNDYHLLEECPAVNSGNPDNFTINDMDNNPRDSEPDCGCYEY